MGSLFAPKIPPMPKAAEPEPVRMPTETDPSIIAAGQRTREAALRRRGRLSTILTDMTQGTIGSSGQRLGA